MDHCPKKIISTGVSFCYKLTLSGDCKIKHEYRSTIRIPEQIIHFTALPLKKWQSFLAATMRTTTRKRKKNLPAQK